MERKLLLLLLLRRLLLLLIIMGATGCATKPLLLLSIAPWTLVLWASIIFFISFCILTLDKSFISLVIQDG